MTKLRIIKIENTLYVAKGRMLIRQVKDLAEGKRVLSDTVDSSRATALPNFRQRPKTERTKCK